MKKLRSAICGLGFGGAFVPIWRDHPMVESVGLFDPDLDKAAAAAARWGIQKVYRSFQEVLDDPELDAVHLVTPIPLHEEQTVAVLRSGKHCACTVPMTTSLDGIRRIVEAVRDTGKTYMMMETTLYTRHFMYLQKMLQNGEIGRIQFMRGSHYQSMENWPAYWMGLPPMWYGTHAISPLRALANAPFRQVYCVGSGSMDEALVKNYGNPFPMESAIFTFENGMRAEATRSLFETARSYQEGLFVYGSRACFEWGFNDGDDPVLTHMTPQTGNRGYITEARAVHLGPEFGVLPQALRAYTVNSDEYDETNPDRTLVPGAAAGHHGSHPHLVHEFVSAILEGRKPWTNELYAGNITAACLCAHQSAMEGGKIIDIPTF